MCLLFLPHPDPLLKGERGCIEYYQAVPDLQTRLLDSLRSIRPQIRFLDLLCARCCHRLRYAVVCFALAYRTGFTLFTRHPSANPLLTNQRFVRSRNFVSLTTSQSNGCALPDLTCVKSIRASHTAYGLGLFAVPKFFTPL